MGSFLSILLILSAITGILLAFKKNSNTLQPPTQSGKTTNSELFIPIDSLLSIAHTESQSRFPDQTMQVDRLDIRPNKGIAKVILKPGYYEFQIDLSTGEIYSTAKRHSDWIEKVHDGSIVSDTFKVVSMNVLGFGLLGLTVSGLFLWFGPKWIRKRKVDHQ